MRNRALHDALREFALDAAAQLCHAVDRGAELEYDIASEGGIYCYRPLTVEFISSRWDELRELPTCATAASALGAGAAPFLRVSGMQGSQAEPALKAMLERLYEDATGFQFPEERFERVYGDVERTLYEDSTRAVVLAPLPGLELAAAKVELGDGLWLVRGDAADAPADAAWTEGEDSEPRTLAMLERDVTPEDPLPLDEARDRFRRLVTGLRLYKPGAVALGSTCWSRTDQGRWQVIPLESAGLARGEPWILVEGEEAELVGFLDVVDRASHGGSVAWALSRFEMGFDRALEAEALSDYVMALRALLDAGSEAGRAQLSLRLAALCAEEGDRRALQRRVELALALERFVMDGGRDEAYLDSIGSESPRTLVAEMERHLRALLRDVMCGYLDPDLRRVAESILLEAPEPFEIDARDLRKPEPAPEPAPEPVRKAEPATTAAAPEPEPEPEPQLDLETVAGVTAAPLDWDYSDPASFSAPV